MFKKKNNNNFQQHRQSSAQKTSTIKTTQSKHMYIWFTFSAI